MNNVEICEIHKTKKYSYSNPMDEDEDMSDLPKACRACELEASIKRVSTKLEELKSKLAFELRA